MRALGSLVAAVTFVSLAMAGCSSSSAPVDPGATTDDAATPTDDVVTSDDVVAVPETPAAPAYPAGPYGLTKGKVFPLITFQGYKGGTGAWVDISTASYYDPDGSKGIMGVYFVVSAQWCPPCKEEARNLPVYYSKSYKARGAVFASAMIENSSKGPATQAVVTSWRDVYHINFDMMLDVHGSRTLPAGTAANPVGLPHNYVIDPRTMKIAQVVEGIDPYIVKCATQADCCSPSQNTATCCDPNDPACADPCACPIIPVGGTAADVTFTCNATVSYCVEPGAKGVIDDLETVMVKNGATPLVATP